MITDDIFASIIDKRTIRPEKNWTPAGPGNFIFAQTIISHVLNGIPFSDPIAVCYDKGRLPASGASESNSYLVGKNAAAYRGKGLADHHTDLLPPQDAPSEREPGMRAADMVAGAFYHKFRHDGWSYPNVLNPKRTREGERVFWKKG